MKRRLAVVAATLAILQMCIAQETQPKKRLTLNGEGWRFSVREPDDWTGDWQKLARSYHSNIIFTRNGQDDRAINIRVRVNDKRDEDTQADLDYDAADYQTKYKDLKTEALALKHPEYATFGRLFYVPDRFYEYVVYLNPGSSSKYMYSVAMSKPKVPATPEEMKAFEGVVQSMRYLKP